MIPAAPEVATRLAALVRIRTVTPPPGPLDDAARATFSTFHAALRGFYPRVFGHEVEPMGRAGLLVRISGGDAPATVLMAHQDVVPAPERWEAEGWSHGPFEGVIADGWVHGRGTLDDKGALTVMLEAVESLLGERWTPAGDLYLSLGADEESYGDCALRAAHTLESRGVSPGLILDEGGAVAVGVFPGLEGEAAVIGVAEKGILEAVLTVAARGGHASTPPRESAPGILARALVRIESHPHRSSLHPVNVELLATVGTRIGGIRGSVLRHARGLRWLFARILPRMGAELAAMTRTTAAITQLTGGPAHNVLATSATATLNIRVAAGSTVADAVAHLRRAIADPRVRIDVEAPSEPSPVSPRGDHPAWRSLTAAVAAAYPAALVVPYVMLAASDSRHLAHLGPTYRFAPLRMDTAQRMAIHGADERVEVECLGRGVAFYRALLSAQ